MRVGGTAPPAAGAQDVLERTRCLYLSGGRRRLLPWAFGEEARIQRQLNGCLVACHADTTRVVETLGSSSSSNVFPVSAAIRPSNSTGG